VKRVSIKALVELVTGAVQTTSPRILLIAMAMLTLKEMELSKCSAPKFWLENLALKILTNL
jgi:hypothetical protein